MQTRVFAQRVTYHYRTDTVRPQLSKHFKQLFYTGDDSNSIFSNGKTSTG